MYVMERLDSAYAGQQIRLGKLTVTISLADIVLVRRRNG